MDSAERIRRKLKEMAGEVGPDVSLLAHVKSVNEAEQTCVLIDDDGGMEFSDVLLRPVIDGNKSFALIPKIDTWALAIRIEDSEDWMVIAVGEIQKVLLNCDEFIINEGTNGGVVKWPQAKEQLDKTNEVLQAILNVLLGAPIPEPGNGSPSALQASLQGALTGKSLGVYDNLEDNKVKH